MSDDRDSTLDKICASYFEGGDLTEEQVEFVRDALDEAWQVGWEHATEYYARGGSFK